MTDIENQLYGFKLGLIATSFGFVLTILWDKWKMRNDDKARFNAIQMACRSDMTANLKILADNKVILEADLNAIHSYLTDITPLCPLQSGGLDMLKHSFPAKLARTKGALSVILDVSQRITEINVFIQYRDQYRIHSGLALGSPHVGPFLSGLQQMDEKLLNLCDDLENKLPQIANLI